jgi:hypothetical protein
MRLSDPTRNALADAFAAQVDAGTGDSTIQLRTGSPPSSITDAAAGTLLAEIVLPAPAFSAASGGTAAANAIGTVQASADGTIGHARVLDGDGNVVEDTGSVGTSGTEVVVNATAVVTGADVTVNSWTVTMPAGTA